MPRNSLSSSNFYADLVPDKLLILPALSAQDAGAFMQEIVDFHKTQAGAAHVIRHCRNTTCCKPGMEKIIYRFFERDEIVATRALKMVGGTLKHGQPPQSTLSWRITAK